MNRQSIKNAKKILNDNKDRIGRVYEWSESLGYKNAKIFSLHFLQFFKERPIKVLLRVRINSIILNLRKDKHSNFKIAVNHSLPNDKALYNFVKRHTGFSPTQIKNIDSEELEHILKKLEGKK